MDSVFSRMENLEASNIQLQDKVENISTRVATLENQAPVSNSAKLSDFEMRLDDMEQRSLNSRLILGISQPIGVSEASATEEAVVGAAATAETTDTAWTFDFSW